MNVITKSLVNCVVVTSSVSIFNSAQLCKCTGSAQQACAPVQRQYSIPVEQYGQENAKSIEKLWEEIQQGETILQEDAGRLVRSLHVVVCRIQDENGRVSS